jgi:GH15 family glucan-1,4-alpha-glucosidase
MIERDGVDGPLEEWTALRNKIHDEVCRFAYDQKRNCFTQYYGSRELDASVLMMALVGFLPAADPRIGGTIAAIERHLMYRGFVHRYTMSEDGRVDGLPPGEGVFLPCSFWLADNYLLQGRHEEALELFHRLCGIANDVGLFSEEYEPRNGRFLGNFPQAYTHVSFINTARRLIAAHNASTKA